MIGGVYRLLFVSEEFKSVQSKKAMKNLLGLLVVAIVGGMSCGQSAESGRSDELQHLEEKKALLMQKRTALRALEQEIAQLERELAEALPSAAAGVVTPVSVVRLQPTDFQHFVEVQGVIVSDEIVKVSPEVGGRLIELEVEEGDMVRKGQLLARIDVTQLRKQLEELETALQLATEVYERQKRLWDQQIGSEIQYLQAKNNKERLEKSIETLQVQLNKAQVYAPISGEVDRLFTRVGELVSPGMPLLQIMDIRHVKVTADVPENYLKAVRKGQRVQVRVPALEQTFVAPIARTGNVIDPSNRTFPIEIPLHNSDGSLKPNLLAVVYINDFTKKDAVVVPLSLVQQDLSGQWYVFVAEEGPEGAVARKMFVSLGDSYEGQVVITQGLKGNELLISDGARSLADNQPIQIVKDQSTQNNG